jgi:hypothetical protein
MSSKPSYQLGKTLSFIFDTQIFPNFESKSLTVLKASLTACFI